MIKITILNTLLTPIIIIKANQIITTINNNKWQFINEKIKKNNNDVI